MKFRYTCKLHTDVLTETLDKHAPAKTKIITVHPVAPWFNGDIATARKERRHAEKKWHETGLTVHKQIHHETSNKVTSMIEHSNANYYKERIESSADSLKAICSCMSELLHHTQPPKLPQCDDTMKLADRKNQQNVDRVGGISTPL